jgi:hypothetical protein
MRTLAIILVALAAMVGSAHANPPTIPAAIVGDWCYDKSATGENSKSVEYALPSWLGEEEKCDKASILSIDQYGFSFSGDEYEPVKVSPVKQDCAPSGCAQNVTVVARDLNASVRVLRTFKFARYKGSMSMTIVELAKAGCTIASETARYLCD